MLGPLTKGDGMDSGTLSIMINLISGAVGGNVAGGVMKGKSLGTLGNSVAGILGGGVGGQILHALGVSVAHGGTDLSSILGGIGSGGVGGAVALLVVALVKGLLGKK
jgi:uncharacterized membrane protein YeaQ/YmgE (transglycosylase-associated protein family)